MSVTESVGTVNIICTDKTGTLTKNDMQVTDLWYAGNSYNVSDEDEDVPSEVQEDLVTAGVLCNAAHTGKEEEKKVFLGDATETASLKLGEKFGITQEQLHDERTYLDEVPFSSERKRSTHIYRADDIVTAYTKGAPEVILERCDRIMTADGVKELSSEHKDQLLKTVTQYAESGLRLLAFSYKEGVDAGADEDTIENNMVFIGLQAMMDPPHEEIQQSFAETRKAGIDTLMLTGDNPVTARAIAQKVGLETTDVLTGEQTEEREDEELYERIRKGTHVFARVSPFHKLRILKLLQQDHRVAMTGDGVNDVLALKRADVGIAMGERGTEVAKEASDMILMDDNYASIVAAIRQGRRIFDNVRKFINYLFVSNIAEIFVIFILTLALTLEEPVLLPLHLLWINLLTDGAPALALGADPANEDIMRRSPREKNAPIIDQRLAIIIGAMSALYVALLIAIYFLLREEGAAVATTGLFTGFVLLEFIRIAVIRAQEKIGWFANPWLLGGLVFSLGLQIALIYSPLAPYFHVVPLDWYPWSVMLAVAVIGFVCSIGFSKILMYWLPKHSRRS
jgi:Ca2+-transporting ATPase